MRPSGFFKVLILMVAVGCFSNLLSLVLVPLFDFFGLNLFGGIQEGMETLMMTPIGLLYIMVVGPVVEELIFRGAVLNRIRPHGDNFAIVMSALLFGAYHMVWFQGLNAFFLGLLLGYVACRYSLKWSMLLHICYNSFLMAISLLTLQGVAMGMDEALVEIVSLAPLLVCLVAGIVILIVKRRQIPAIFQAGRPRLPKPFRAAFTSPFLIILLIILAGIASFMLTL
jgi:membrane protease YdiL (CAAX protease family)